MATLIMKKPRLSLWQKMYVGAIAQGLWITLKHALRNTLNQKHLLTYQYPEEKKPLPEYYRAEHRLM